MIEYAKIMTKEELSDFFSSISKRQRRKKLNANNVLSENKDKLIADYYELEKSQMEEYYVEKRRLLELRELWYQKKCDVCDSKLRLVEYVMVVFGGVQIIGIPRRSIRHFQQITMTF